jgi:hypothetical protein
MFLIEKLTKKEMLHIVCNIIGEEALTKALLEQAEFLATHKNITCLQCSIIFSKLNIKTLNAKKEG